MPTNLFASITIMKSRIDSLNLIRFGGVALTLFAIISCSDTDGPILNSLLRVSAEEAGDHCADGGQKIEVGTDKDSNGELSSSEVSTTAYVCKDATSHGGTVTTSELFKGDAHCQSGGFSITTGVDSNGNGTLEKSESMTRYVCNGASGEPGETGAAGPSGADGKDGKDGIDGAPGATGTSGVDGTDGEDGADGTPGPKGDKGAQGDTGARGENGAQGDTGTQGEVGAAGKDGLNSLIKVVAEGAGTNCAAGGVKIQVGLDTNRDTVLDDSEVQSTTYLCSVFQPV